jgi:hypothetical protein
MSRDFSARGASWRRSGPPGPENSGKVAGIVRRCTCGVKKKRTIPSGGVAKIAARLFLLVADYRKFAPKFSFFLYNPAGLAHNL